MDIEFIPDGLRVTDAAAEQERADSTGRRRAEKRGNGQRILYLDDEERLVRAVGRTLKGLGYQVEGFTRAEQALAAFRNTPDRYALAIVDNNMPGASGLDVARELIELRPSLPVALYCGCVTDELLKRAGEAGIREVMCKPSAVAELAEVMHRLVTGTPANPPLPGVPAKLPSTGFGLPQAVAIPGVRANPTRTSLEELWKRQQVLISDLANTQVHDLNNLLAVVQANAFLLRSCTATDGLDAVRAIEEAAEAGAGLVDDARALKPARTASARPVTLESALALSGPLVERLGRSDVGYHSSLAAEAEGLLVDAALVDKVFLTLVVLALELLPGGGTLSVAAGLRNASTPCAVISIALTQPQVPAYLSAAANALQTVNELVPLALARALALRLGGDVTVSSQPDQGLTLKLLLPPAAVS